MMARGRFLGGAGTQRPSQTRASTTDSQDCGGSLVLSSACLAGPLPAPGGTALPEVSLCSPRGRGLDGEQSPSGDSDIF